MLETIFSRNTAPVNPLDEAERAINNKDYPALAAAAGKIAALVPNNWYLVEPLHLIATRLAESAEYIPAAIEAAKVAADYAPSGSDLERQAVSTILKHVEALPEAAQRIEAAKVAARYAPSGSDLARQAVSTWSKHVEALPEAAQRIEAAKVAARYAPSGSDLARQAVSTILKHVKALPDPAQRIEAAKVAASYAASGSDLEQQATEKLRELQRAPAPDAPTSAAARTFVGKFHL
jgi:hypothetical protein